MKVTFLGQGFEAKSEASVGKQLIKFFADKNFHTFTGISAFASQAGVKGLSSHIDAAKKHLKNITIVTGVDQKGTSQEALRELFLLNIKVFVFYQPSITIFHPKIYLFEGDAKSELIIGSSNLTSQGLFANVEASLLVSIDNSVEQDRDVIRQVKNYFQGIFDLSDPNLKRLTVGIVRELVAAKIVPTEEERRAAQDKADNAEQNGGKILISNIFPNRAIAKLPAEFRGRTKPRSNAPISLSPSSEKAADKGKLVWTRRKLPSSSVQGGKDGTNPSGGLRLVQDDFEINGKKIAQSKYFREDLFGKYSWKEIKRAPFVEAATIPVDVTILGKFIGKFDLEVRHKPSGAAGQGNYTTSISWGKLGEIIRKANLTGSRLDLYAPRKKGNPYHMVIS